MRVRSVALLLLAAAAGICAEQAGKLEDVLTVSELQRVLKGRGVDARAEGLTEKTDLVERLVSEAKAQPAEERVQRKQRGGEHSVVIKFCSS